MTVSTQHPPLQAKAFVDGSRLITEACVRAGADVFIGYPITPANLLYSYGRRRYPSMLAAPDEITTLQWMSGYAIAGHIPVTATSFPGYALMLESINMAVMMELPMVIILVQRLGPATGTATTGAQGDVALLHGSISGGISLPTLCISSLTDCWELSSRAVEMAVRLRTPIVLLTSKEMVMTQMSFDLASLCEIRPVSRPGVQDGVEYRPYAAGDSLVPAFLPVTDTRRQVRFTASTHDDAGILQNTSPEALANTRRLQEKLDLHLGEYTLYEYDEDPGAHVLLLSFDVTAQATRESAAELRRQGAPVSLLIAKTLFPVPGVYGDIIGKYARIVVAEENSTGLYRRLLFGDGHDLRISGVNALGRMISPEDIIGELRK